jgi:hypothetical protein
METMPPSELAELELDRIPDTQSHAGTGDPSTSQHEGYSRELKIHAAAMWLLKGTILRACQAIGVPFDTFRVWTKQDWWPIAIAAARLQYQHEIVAGFSEIQNLATQEVIDRLTNGNQVLVGKNEDGEKIYERQKMSGKDAAIILAIATDKRQIMTGNPTSIRESRQKTREQLANKIRSNAAAPTELKVVGGTEK